MRRHLPWKGLAKLLGPADRQSRVKTSWAVPRVEALEARYVPDALTFTWSHQMGATSNWSDTKNWLVGGMAATRAPQSGDSLVFNGTNNSNSSDDIANLALKDFTVSGYTALITQSTPTLSVSGTFTLDTGRINTGSGTLTVGASGLVGSFVWDGGTITGNLVLGDTNVATPTTITTAGQKTLDNGKITNYGTITWKNGDIDVINTSTIDNKVHGKFDIQCGNSITQSVPGANRILNESGATFIKDVGATTSAFIQPNFTNNGTLEVDAGTISFNHSLYQQSGTTILNSGTIAVTDLSTFFVQGGSMTGVGTIAGPLEIDPNGTLTPGLNGAPGNLNVTGSYDQKGSLVINVNAAGAMAKLHAEAGVTLETNSSLTVNVANGFAATSGNFTFLDGYTSVTGNFATDNLSTQTWMVGGVLYRFYEGSSVGTLTVGPWV